LTYTCVSDSYQDGEEPGNETFLVKGVGNQSLFAFDWPLGSNASANVSVIDSDQDDASGNLQTNSNFEEWTGGVPDGWEVITGGSLFTEDNTFVYDEGGALAITGDGATQAAIKQVFDDVDGTTGLLLGVSQYSVCLFMRRDGTAAATGVLTIDLVDENNDVINDEAGNPNSFDIDLTTLTVDYQSFTGSFRTPYMEPEEYAIRIRQSTPLESGRTVYLDRMSMGEMTQLYLSGPYVAVHSGGVAFRVGDYTTCQVTNSRDAIANFSTWQTLFATLFPIVIDQEILLPSSSSPTISDALITA
jgi:hypothetical protein